MSNKKKDELENFPQLSAYMSKYAPHLDATLAPQVMHKAQQVICAVLTMISEDTLEFGPLNAPRLLENRRAEARAARSTRRL